MFEMETLCRRIRVSYRSVDSRIFDSSFFLYRTMYSFIRTQKLKIKKVEAKNVEKKRTSRRCAEERIEMQNLSNSDVQRSIEICRNTYLRTRLSN